MKSLWPAVASLASGTPKPEELAAGCASACAACGFLAIFLPIAIIALHVCLLVWVARDSKARGMSETVGWLILVALTGLVGLIVYLCIRPSGAMVFCAKCNKRSLATLPKCPHCAK